MQYENGNYYTYRTAITSLFFPESIKTSAIAKFAVTPEKLSLGGPNWSTTGTLQISGNLEMATGTSNNPLVISMGYNRAAAGESVINLYSDPGTIADASISRKSGTNGNLEISNIGTGAIIFNTQGSPRMEIEAGGNVGINTLTPNERLTVSGNISSSNDIRGTNLYASSVVYANGGNSVNWNAAYTAVAPNSATWNDVTEKMPLYTNLPITRVGSLGYLDIDLKSDFKGPQSTDYNKPYVFQERDGSVVGLRGGYDGAYKRQFYFIANSLDDLDNALITDIEYRPSFLASNEFVSELADCNEHGLFVSVGNTANSNLKYYWININGTLDSKAHTFVDLTSNVFNGDSIANSAVVYCPEKNLFIKTALIDTAGSAAPITGRSAISFYIYANDTLKTLLGSYQQTDFKDTLTLGTNNGVVINEAWFNHTQRPNIQYFVENNTLYISHLVSLTLIYSSGLRNVGYNSVAIYNIASNTWSNQYNPPYNFNPDNTATYITPFFAGGTGFLDYGESISLRKILKLNNNKIIVTRKPHAWNPVYFYTRTHTINAGYTWKDVVLRPFDLINPPTTADSEVVHVPDDASLLGKRLWFPAWLSDTKMMTVNESKNANESSPSGKTAIVNFSSRTNTSTTVGSVNANTLPEIRTLDPFHTTLDSAGNMRVKVVSNSKIIEINGDTLAITNNNVNTLPSNYDAQFNTIIEADRVSLGLPSGLQTNKIFYHIINGLYILSYGFFRPTPTPTVLSYFRIVELTGSTFNTIGSPVLAATYTDATRGNNWPPTLAQGRYDYGIQTNNSCGIYNHNSTTCYIIFKGIGAEAPGSNLFPRIAVNLNPTAKTITQWSRVGGQTIEYPSWTTEFVGVHPYYGPCSMLGHVDQYAQISMKFFDNTSLGYQARMLAGFNSALAGTDFSTRVIPLTLQSAKGFNVFISETPVFLQGSYYTLPTQSVNLADPAYFGPTNVKNKTIYVYVELINNTPELVFLLTQPIDSTKFIYIGTIVTDNLGIISSDFEKLSKIDTLQVNGSVTLLEGPSEPKHATTKEYVDALSVRVEQIESSALPVVMNIRMSLSPTSPLPGNNIEGASATTLYVHPYKGDAVTLYNTTSSRWATHTFSSVISKPLNTICPTANTNYDIYLNINNGSYEITSEVLPAGFGEINLTPYRRYLDGIAVHPTDSRKRLIGCLRTDTVGGRSAQTFGGRADGGFHCKQYIWNAQNQIPINCWEFETGTYYAQTPVTPSNEGGWTNWRKVNNSANHRFSFIAGDYTAVNFTGQIYSSYYANLTLPVSYTSIAMNSEANTPTEDSGTLVSELRGSDMTPRSQTLRSFPPGAHFIQLLENIATGGQNIVMNEGHDNQTGYIVVLTL